MRPPEPRPACMGGGCLLRQRCPFYEPTNPGELLERYCPRGRDGDRPDVRPLLIARGLVELLPREALPC